MSSDIVQWYQQCEHCQLHNVPAAQGFMGLLLASRPNDILAIDFAVLVLVMTDVFSKFAIAVPTRDQRAETVAQVWNQL